MKRFISILALVVSIFTLIILSSNRIAPSNHSLCSQSSSLLYSRNISDWDIAPLIGTLSGKDCIPLNEAELQDVTLEPLGFMVSDLFSYEGLKTYGDVSSLAQDNVVTGVLKIEKPGYTPSELQIVFYQGDAPISSGSNPALP